MNHVERVLNPKQLADLTSASLSRFQAKLVEKEVIKYASAHDLRRSFGTRWASKVKPAVLQLLMRHTSIETTRRYYVAQDADEVADELWATVDAGRTNGNTASESALNPGV